MQYWILGALRPAVGNTVGLPTRFSGRYPIKFRDSTYKSPPPILPGVPGKNGHVTGVKICNVCGNR